jgi:hypothetical protein
MAPAESPKPEEVGNKGTGNFIPKSTGAQSVALLRDTVCKARLTVIAARFM